jgi:nicotinamidase-related amidase
MQFARFIILLAALTLARTGLAADSSTERKPAMNTPRRALIVIDVQNEYVTGGLHIEYPAVATSLANIGNAMDAAHAVGVPVIVVQNWAAPTAPLFAKGSPGWQLHEVVASRPRDHFSEKQPPSAFTGTGLADWLKQQGIDTLTVAGYMTHNCVAATVYEALHRGLAVEVLGDATGSVPYANRAGAASARQIHDSYLVVFQSRFAAVMPTAEWITHIKAGTMPERDTIYRSHARATGAEPGAVR